MAALDFPPNAGHPAAPTVGEQYLSPAVTGVPVYTWDGEKWTTKGGAVGSTGGADDPPLMDGTAAVGSVRSGREKITGTGRHSKLGAVRHQLFTASGTYTRNANLISAIVEVQGGGGGGGAATGSVGNVFIGGGGGGGGYCRHYSPGCHDWRHSYNYWCRWRISAGRCWRQRR